MLAPAPARLSGCLKHRKESTRIMAIKNVKTAETVVPAAEETAPVAPVANALAGFSAMNLFNVEAPKQMSNLLPQVKIPYPVEVKPGKPFTMANVFRVGLFDGSKFDTVAAPYTMTVIAARDASRKLVQKNVGGKIENEYERAYKSMGTGFDASAAVYEQHCIDPMAERGISFIVGIIDAAGKAVIAELPAFKVLKDYWNRPLHQARAQNNLGLKVTVEDHSANLTTSKNDPNKAYLDPKRFTQHEVIELTPEQAECIAAVLSASKDKFEAWAKQ